MANFEVLPDGRDDWHFSQEFETLGPAQAAEQFAEYTDWHSTEFAYMKEGGIVQVRKKGGGEVYRYSIFGETRPHYEARMLLPTPTKGNIMTDIEAVARVINPRAWEVMDDGKAAMLRKYKGENIGYDPAQFHHKESMAIAQAAIKSLGWKSPAEVAEIDKAAQAEMKERAADLSKKWGVTILQFPAENLQEHVEAMMDEIGPNIAEAIRALTPSSGPWQRVPEGSKDQAIKIVEELEAQMEHSLNAYSLPLWPEEAALVLRTFRAMIGAEGKP